MGLRVFGNVIFIGFKKKNGVDFEINTALHLIFFNG
jgi:hypothetical protein